VRLKVYITTSSASKVAADLPGQFAALQLFAVPAIGQITVAAVAVKWLEAVEVRAVDLRFGTRARFLIVHITGAYLANTLPR
jgi:hypothetical protein